jgi:hypothetical protein
MGVVSTGLLAITQKGELLKTCAHTRFLRLPA